MANILIIKSLRGMFMMNIDFNQIKSYTDGKAGLIVGLCEQIGLSEVFDRNLTQPTGRPAELPYGVLAELMLINMADNHHPLSRLNEYFENVDLDSLFNRSIDRTKLNDDRFGGFLDLMQNFGCQKILSEIAAKAFACYGIKITTVNFDTTSKIMWGEYETTEGMEGVVEITYGYSKQKRQDKKQIKLSLGTAQGIVIDGQVLSGNLDDKTFNVNNLEHVKDLMERFSIATDEFYYIADSAAFTQNFLDKAKKLNIHVVTRMSDNVNKAKEAIKRATLSLDSLEKVEIQTSKKASIYHITEETCNYYGTPLKMAVCYSQGLKKTKKKTIEKKVVKESQTLDRLMKSIQKRTFACEEDAQIECSKYLEKELKKVKYHQIHLEISTKEIKRRGRPSLDPNKNTKKFEYVLEIKVNRDQEAIEKIINESCIFVLATTDISLTAIEILKEYKTQSAVEKKFQYLKSPQFVNSLYVESPKRVEALGYLMLILLLLLSVAEYVVRRELKSENASIIGPGKVKMTKPSLIAIYRVFYSVVTSTITINGKVYRGYHKPLKNNVKTIMRYLGIPENLFIRGSG